MMQPRLFFSTLGLLALLGLASCGGGGGSSGSSPFVPNNPPGSSVTAADLVVQLSSSTIANSGSANVIATVTALDANRNTVPGVALTVSADSDAVVTVGGTAGSVTDAAGRVQATVTIGSNRNNRAITVSAKSGDITRSAILQVVDSPANAVPTSIDLIATATTVGTAGDNVTIRAFVKDANNNALQSANVVFSASTGTLSSIGTVTDSSGSASALFSAGADRSNRAAVITVSSGAITSRLTLPITGTRLSLSGPSSLILGNSTSFDVVVTDSKSNVVPGLAIAASSSLGNAIAPAAGTSAITNSNGQVRFTYVANNAGTDNLVFLGANTSVSPTPALKVSGDDFTFVAPAASSTVAVNFDQPLIVRLRSGGIPQAGRTINFAASGGTLSPNIAVTNNSGEAQVSLRSGSAGPVTVQATVQGTSTSTTLPLTIVATTPSKLVLQINPTTLAPNTEPASNNQAQVLAKVTDADGNPVQGQTVNFTREIDPSGGNLLQVSATTDANGVASVAYRSGAQSTANDGVVLRGTVATAPLVTDSAKATVSRTSLFIALGTGNTITNLDPQTYQKDWVAYVTDSNGVPVNGASLTVKAIPTDYRTGQLRFDSVAQVWAYVSPVWQCRNEDNNANGILDAGEDDNADVVLWPGNVIAVTPGSVQTANGRATLSLIYAESYAPWVRMRLTVSATVAGTESRTDAEFIVTGSAPDFSDATNPPAGVISPFGLLPKPGAVCTQVVL